MTVRPRWKKVLGDVAATPFRSALAVAAMAAGTFGLGMILTAHAVLTREIAASYGRTHPAAATLYLDRVDDAVVAAARGVAGIGDAEARPVITARIRVGQDEWAPLVLYVVRDFGDLRLDRFSRDAGAWPPGDGEVLLERSGLAVARAAIGDSVTVRLAAGVDRRLRVAGTVHAPGLAPGWMDHVVTGFVSWRSIVRAEGPSAAWETAALRIAVAERSLDEDHIRRVTGRAQAALERARRRGESRGRRVLRVTVPPPGRHPHADQMDTFLFLLGAFAALTVALGAVLVANLIHSLLAEQVRQVGILKAIGGSTRQVAALYLAQVAILAAGALGLGLPLGMAAGRAYARFAAAMLNISILDAGLPVWVAAVQIAVGLGVPLLAALGPVAQASRLTIHQALSGDGGRRPFGALRTDRWLARAGWLPRPLALSLRSTLHDRGRLALTVGTLAFGGALFLSALNVSGSWARALAGDAAARRYDVAVQLSAPQPTARVAGLVAALPGVERVECWSESAAYLVGAGGVAAARVNLIGPDPGTALLALPLLAGRWLAPRDRGAVVINQALLASGHGLQLGGQVVLRVGGHDVAWPIVGVIKELNPLPTAYAPAQAVLGASGQVPGTTRGMRVVTRRHEPAAQRSVQRGIERALAGAGIGVLDVQRLADRRQALADHLVILESALLLAAGLVVLVGGLGLATTLSITVAERTREIGILGALGATPRLVARCVVLESLALGALSWCAAVAAAVPVTLALDAAAGEMFIRTPLDLYLSPRAAGGWLLLVLALSSLSSFYPAWRAARLPVREALAHE